MTLDFIYKIISSALVVQKLTRMLLAISSTCDDKWLGLGKKKMAGK